MILYGRNNPRAFWRVVLLIIPRHITTGGPFSPGIPFSSSLPCQTAPNISRKSKEGLRLLEHPKQPDMALQLKILGPGPPRSFGFIPRFSSRADRIRVPFFSVVYCTRGTESPKRNGKRGRLGDLDSLLVSSPPEHGWPKTGRAWPSEAATRSSSPRSLRAACGEAAAGSRGFGPKCVQVSSRPSQHWNLFGPTPALNFGGGGGNTLPPFFICKLKY